MKVVDVLTVIYCVACSLATASAKTRNECSDSYSSAMEDLVDWSLDEIVKCGETAETAKSDIEQQVSDNKVPDLTADINAFNEGYSKCSDEDENDHFFNCNVELTPQSKTDYAVIQTQTKNILYDLEKGYKTADNEEVKCVENVTKEQEKKQAVLLKTFQDCIKNSFMPSAASR